MNGQWMGNKAIRYVSAGRYIWSSDQRSVNWANQKPAGTTGASGPITRLDYETVLAQATQFNVTVYIVSPPPPALDISLANLPFRVGVARRRTKICFERSLSHMDLSLRSASRIR